MPTYCEVAFLDNFYKQRPSLDQEEDDYVEKWILLNKVIKSRCTLFINSYDEFQEKVKNNPYTVIYSKKTGAKYQNDFDYFGSLVSLIL